ncbi:MAG: protein-export rane protein SecD, partial [Burkholderiales bacterium]|nr:protein-export rane protein SecD [Burkholderiales bacterium]
NIALFFGRVIKMNKFPFWKYLIIIIAVAVGFIYTIPNFYGETPAVQISAKNSSTVLDNATLAIINEYLAGNQITPNGEIFDGKTLKLRFSDTDVQLKARDLISQKLGSSYIVALNLVPASPLWFAKLNAKPMFLGLDLRGGVHFLLEIDMNAAVKKTLDKYAADIKRDMRTNKIRYGSIQVNSNSVVINLRDDATATNAYNQLKQDLPGILLSKNNDNSLSAVITPEEMQKIKEAAVKQNILILHNRVNELGVAEPIIQQQGSDRIVVELPGIQDTARARDLLGRTADSITDAQPGFDENGAPAVNLRLDSSGAAIFKQLTGDNVGHRMAMVLVDNGISEVVTAPVIKVQIGGGQVQISGAMTVEEANDVSLLLRSGSLAAPMRVIEENTVGPSLGKENISKGFHSVMWGFAAIAVFMIIYYMIFGIIAVISLSVNLLLLIAVLSMLQASLTLPGIAAIALALGMAIDSNVLINERIREELRLGHKVHLAIQAGYEHAWATILDSNVTTLIAGLALLAFGSGPVKGFAVVHCLGILTSMFSAVMVSRGIVGFLYAKRHITKLYI